MTRPAGVARLRAGLARTWHAFLVPFGGKPTAIQVAAGPVLLAGRDALIEAPTASGKTEAVAAPLVERWLADPREPPGVIYVVPTRALVNDLYRRLAVPLAELSVPLDRRTGDHPRPVGRRPPAVLLTTPESLDSLMCRYPKMVARTRALVLDEVHLLEGSARGDQMAVQVARLRKLVASQGRTVQVVGLSATAGCGERLLARFLVDGVRVRVEGARSVELVVEDWPGTALVGASVKAVAEREGARKVLAFVNRRQDAEELSSVLGAALPCGGASFAHHGSLARSLRESVERRFLEARHAVVVATSTLELGIDVGDVDLVVLPFPPADVTSFLQRVGRGNRRTGSCRALAYARSAAELAWLGFLGDSARAGELYPDPLPFRPSVLMQQMVSLLFQSPQRWITVRALRERLPEWLAPDWPEERLGRLASALIEAGLLAAGPRGKLVATALLERDFERGRMHSAIDPEPPGVTIYDELTREPLGTVGACEPGAEPGSLSLAGRGMNVVFASEGALYVSGGASAAPARYNARPGPRKGLALCQAFRARLGIPGRGPVLGAAGDMLALIHFGGTLCSRLLATWLEREGHAESTGVGGLAVRFHARDARLIALPDRQDLEVLVEDLAGDIVRLIGGGPFARHLPRAEKIALARAAVQLDRLAEITEAGICGPGERALPDGLGWL